MTQSIEQMAREIESSVKATSFGQYFQAYQAAKSGIEAGIKLGREQAAGVATDHSKRWGTRWQNEGGYDKKDDLEQHWRLAGFSDGAATVAKAIRNLP